MLSRQVKKIGACTSACTSRPDGRSGGISGASQPESESNKVHWEKTPETEHLSLLWHRKRSVTRDADGFRPLRPSESSQASKQRVAFAFSNLFLFNIHVQRCTSFLKMGHMLRSEGKLVGRQAQTASSLSEPCGISPDATWRLTRQQNRWLRHINT